MRKGFRGNRKRVRRVAKKAKMSFSSRVLSVVNKRQDLKVGQLLSYSITDVREAINSINRLTNVMRILPDITQGTQEFSRIGNRITLKKIVMRGYYRIQYPIGSQANSRILIRNLVLKQRSVLNAGLLTAGTIPIDYNLMLEPANPYSGGVPDYNTPVNANAFIQKKQFKRCITAEYDGVSANGLGQADSYVFFNYTMTFGKGKVLNYGTDGSAQPTDFPYFMVHSATNLGSSAALAGSLISFNLTCTPYFTDD